MPLVILPCSSGVLAAIEDMQHCVTVVAAKGTLTKWVFVPCLKVALLAKSKI